MVLVTGCSKNTLAPAKVSGRISYKGAPIKAGSMAFHTAEGNQYPANISEDGTYSATDLPEGEMIVTVDTSHLDPAKKPAQSKDYDKRMKVMAGRMQEAAPGAEKEQPFTKIPEKYSKPNTSPITVKLTSGRQVKDIDLE
jgi:hypothetical protein